MIWYCIIIHTAYAELKSPRNYFHGLLSKLEKTMFCVVSVVWLFLDVFCYFIYLRVFFLIALSFLEVLVHVFDILQFVLFLPWNQRIICHLEGPFVRFACVSVFRDDSVEPYVPSVLNGYSIKRFPRHRERAVKHL